jgi:hypothetical protein
MLARHHYRRIAPATKRPELAGEGLVRSAGGWEKIILARRYGEHLKSDERILGDSDFVDEVLGNAGEHFDVKCPCNGVDIEKLAEIVAGVLGIYVAEVWRVGRKPTSLQARYLMCYRAKDIGLTPTAVGKRLKLSSSGASRAAQRGTELAVALGFSSKQLMEK